MITNKSEYRKLDLEKINKRITKFVSTEESLKDITPIKWNDDILSGRKKVVITEEKQ